MTLSIRNPMHLWFIMRAVAQFNASRISRTELLVVIEMQGYNCEGHDLLANKPICTTMLCLEDGALIIRLSNF